MKKLTLTFAAILSMTAVTLSQNVERAKDGNFLATTQQKTVTDSLTTYTYTDGSGKVEPVYQGSKGSYYVARISKKSGKFYRKYLKTEEQ
jgi:hypothetical protein